MKKIYILAFLVGISLYSKAQNGTVGINKQAPDAALDIKSNDQNKVLRFSTIPTDIDGDEFDFFVGKKDGDAYDLRRLSKDDFVERIPTIDLVHTLQEEIPTLNRIVIRNSTEQDYTYNSKATVNLDETLLNTDESSFQLHNKGIVFKKAGTYEVSSFVGFEQLWRYVDGDMIVSIEKGKINQSEYSNINSTIISRKRSSTPYNAGNGIGAAFTFVDNFEPGDIIRIKINTLDFTRNVEIDFGDQGSGQERPEVKLLPDATISVTKLTKDSN